MPLTPGPDVTLRRKGRGVGDLENMMAKKPTGTLTVSVDDSSDFITVEPTKKPRTESPERIALRAHQKRRELQELISGEIDRHATRLGGLQERLREHDADCEKLPEPVRALLEKLAGAL